MDSQVRYPASRAQQAVWFSSRIFPDSPIYNLLWQVKISGALDVPTLLRSIQSILDRHETLRTTFSMENEDLIQVVSPSLTCECPLVDLSDLLPEKKQAQLDALGRGLGLAPFDLENGPLIRFRLVRFDDEDHRLLVSLHHMVTDGTSWPLFVDELTACYGGLPLAPLPMQYGKYAAWQREMLEAGS